MTSIASQTAKLIPQYIRENHPAFSQFVEYYLKFIEQTHVQNGQILHRPYDLINNLILSHDIDQTNRRVTPKDQINDADVEYTITKFLEFYKQNYMNILPYLGKKGEDESHYYDQTGTALPEQISTEFTNLIKRIRDYYQNKGNVDSFEFFFRAIFNVDMETFYPKVDILRASDGNWYNPYYVRLALYPEDQKPEDTDWPNVELLQLDDVDLLYNKVIRSFNWVYDDQGAQVFDENGDPEKEIIARAVVGPRIWSSNIVEAWDTDMVPWITLIEREGQFNEGDKIDICYVCDETQDDIELENIVEPDGKQLRILDSNLDSSYTYVGDQSNLERDINGDIVGNDQVAYTGLDNEGVATWAVFFDTNGSDDSTQLGPEVNPEYVGVETRFEGRWLDNDGFLSDRKYLQDNFYYQDFSYEIKTTISRAVWDRYVQGNLHPAGLLLFNVLLAEDVDPFVFVASFDKVWQIYWETVTDASANQSIAGHATEIRWEDETNVFKNAHRFQQQDKYFHTNSLIVDNWAAALPEEYESQLSPLIHNWVFIEGEKMTSMDEYCYLDDQYLKIDWKDGRNANLAPVLDALSSNPETMQVNHYKMNQFKNPVITPRDATVSVSLLSLGSPVTLTGIPDTYIDAGTFAHNDTNNQYLVFYKGQLIPNFTLTVSHSGGYATVEIDVPDDTLTTVLGGDEANIENEFEIIPLNGDNEYVFFDSRQETRGTIPATVKKKDDVLVFVGATDEFMTLLNPSEYHITSTGFLEINRAEDPNVRYRIIGFPSVGETPRHTEATLSVETYSASEIRLESLRIEGFSNEPFYPYAISTTNVITSQPYYFTGAADHTVLKIEKNTGNVVNTYNASADILSMQLYGDQLYVALAGGDLIELDPADLSEVQVNSGASTQSSYAMEVTESYIYLGGFSHILERFNRNDLTANGTYTGHGSTIWDIVEYEGSIYSVDAAGGLHKTTNLVQDTTFSEVNDLRGVEAFDGFIWAGGYSRKVFKLDPDTLSVVDSSSDTDNLGNSVSRLTRLTHFGDYIYVVGNSPRTLWRINKSDMTDIDALATGPDYDVKTDGSLLFTIHDGSNNRSLVYDLQGNSVAVNNTHTSWVYGLATQKGKTITPA